MSVHNVEVYRCRACGEDVVTSPAGFTLTDEEVNAHAEEHRKVCTAPLERITPDAED